MRRVLIAVAAAMILGGAAIGVAWAATGYNLKCLNPKCGYAGKCVMGPTKLMDSVDGYCVACDKWVNVRWKRNGGEAPKPLGKVWSAETGKTLPVYACPNCKGPFLPMTEDDKVKDSKYGAGLKENEFILHCPKCGEASLKATLEMFLD
jgi:hypothetical protein